jgi:hypothetical protein
VFKLEAEDGTWLSEVRLGPPNWKPGRELDEHEFAELDLFTTERLAAASLRYR